MNSPDYTGSVKKKKKNCHKLCNLNPRWYFCEGSHKRRLKITLTIGRMVQKDLKSSVKRDYLRGGLKENALTWTCFKIITIQ